MSTTEAPPKRTFSLTEKYPLSNLILPVIAFIISIVAANLVFRQQMSTIKGRA